VTEWRRTVELSSSQTPRLYHFVQTPPTRARSCASTQVPLGVAAFQEGIASKKGVAGTIGDVASPTTNVAPL
jgi:hypothetical protein